MSAGTPTLRVAPRFRRSAPAAAGDLATAGRPWIRVATFGALALYGLVRWATLLHPAPTWRLVGLLLLALVAAGGLPLVRRVSLPAAIVAAILLCLIAFPLSGLPWHSFRHVRITVSADLIGTGLQNLAGVLVPYLGTDHAVRLVIVLGAAVLLLDSAMVFAFAPRPFGDARRAAAALPLIALAVVPSALVRPQLPYLQGLVLFGLLVAFMWGEKLRRGAAGTALAIAALAGVGAAIVAPKIDPHKPWVDYRAWAGTIAPAHIDAFNWNQTYGPLHWPRAGHEVLTVSARRGDYWKAEDLDFFNGFAWQAGSNAVSPALPSPDESALQKWTERLQVTIKGMRTYDVIAAGYAAQPAISGGVTEGGSDGTWSSSRALGPGTTYSVLAYSPTPSAGQLRAAGMGYPNSLLVSSRTLAIPYRQLTVGDLPAVTFPPFHSNQQPYVQQGYVPRTAELVSSSPYGPAYTLARQLAAEASTPYAFVTSVQRYLAHGYTYNEKPPRRAYPLESFLFRDRLGYCQQFSGAMALLLRMGGLPARVASGFTAGSPNASNTQWTVSDIDAHAWVEVWFPHYGWVRFDPTPAVAPARGGASQTEFVKNLPGEGSAPTAAANRGPGATSSSSTPHASSAGGGLSPLLVIPALAVILLVAFLSWSLLLRPAASEDELVAELERALSRSGRPLADGVTLASLEHRFRSSPSAAAYVRELRLGRYAGSTAHPTAAQRRALRNQLRFGLGLSGRLRALWALPPRPRLGSKPRS
ncbi:MAG TPA: transglutaminase-like domain-containing protein [Solirubrobacteraceae bacterium]|jgi:transglutaminase-like putative cysteine protease